MKRFALVLVVAATAAACGGGSPANPVQPIVARPQPTPTPSATPSPCEHGSCGTNTAVVRAQLRIYMMFDDKGQPIAVPDPVKQVVQEPIPVGYRFRLDVTGRDADGHETDGRGDITWFYSGEDLVHTDRRSPWQRDITVAAPGLWSVYVVFDGVSSNGLNFTFVAR